MPRSMRSLRAALGLLAAVSLGAAGCGDDAVRDHDGVLRLTLDEYRIVPEHVSVHEGEIKLIAHNAGVLTHNVVVQKFNVKSGETPTVYGRTDTSHPGQTVSATMRLAPGKYRLVCTIANHDDLGQYATLQVTAD